jgi:hemolysin
VVIANPNGVGCDGCSFINTSKLTMVSGQSRMSDGAITGFKMDRCEISMPNSMGAALVFDLTSPVV